MKDYSSCVVFDEIKARLKLIYGSKNDSKLSDQLGIKRSTLGNWKSRNTIPYTTCVNVSVDTGVDLLWLLTGQGAMYSNPAEKLKEAPATYQPRDIKKNQRKARLEAFIDVFFEDSTEDDQAWLEGQLKRAIPEYAEFISDKTSEQKSQKKRAG